MKLTLPFPLQGLSPNARLSWRAKAKLTAQYREDCGWLALYALRASRLPGPLRYFPLEVLLLPPVEADVEFVVPDYRRRDRDNLLSMLKPAWDGFVDAGLLEDDSWDRFRVANVTVVVGKPPCVNVTLRSVETV